MNPDKLPEDASQSDPLAELKWNPLNLYKVIPAGLLGVKLVNELCEKHNAAIEAAYAAGWKARDDISTNYHVATPPKP